MKVLTIGSDRKLFEDNSPVLARQIKYAQSLERLDIIVFSLKKFDLLATHYSMQTNLTIYPTNSLSRLSYIPDALKIAKSLSRPDIVSTQDPFESGVAGYLTARHWKVPLHLQLHTDFLSPYFWQDSFLNKIRFYIAKFLIRQVDHLRVVSRRIKDSIVAAGLMTAEKITIRSIAVDAEKIRNAPIKTDLHKKYPQFDFIILMASRITREKHIGLAIEAMKEIVPRHPNVGLVIVGDGLMREGLGFRVQGLGLNRNIIFEGWSDDLPSYYKTADLFLITSDYEGYGMTVVEALAAGLPVVMTDVGVAGELVIDGQNGLVVPVGDRSALIAALDKYVCRNGSSTRVINRSILR